MFTTLALLLPAAALPVPATADQLVVEPFACPAPARSGEPVLTVGADGALYLSWVVPQRGGASRMVFARHAGDAWGEPRLVVESGDLFLNWTDLPSVTALADGTLAASWLEKSGQHGYGARAAVSKDGGATWSKPLQLHDSDKGVEHGFVSLLPLDSGSFGAVWLDGRNQYGGGKGETGVYFRTLDAQGKLGKETVLDSRACDCCPTSAAFRDGRGIAVFRDRTEDEIRDISFVRFDRGRWSKPQPLHSDGWKIAGCPVNGAAVTFVGERAAVAWYTGGGAGGGSVRLAFSSSDLRRFEKPLTIDEGSPEGRASLAALSDGSLIVAWLESGEGAKSSWRSRHVQADGTLGPVTELAGVAAGRRSGRLYLAPQADDSVLAAWTADGPPRKVEMARLRRAD